MLLLLLFALIAGAGTAITPCVLPVLPALLSAGAVGGRRRPLGIVIGLAITFTIAIVALAQITRGVGLASGATRTLAVVVLIVFGVTLMAPPLAARIQAPLSRLARFGPRTRGDGFWSGLGVGGALGFVCAPCAGPILAAVISVSASGHTSVRLVAVAVAYTAGLSAVLLLYTLGGRRAMAAVRRHAKAALVEPALGLVLLLTGIAMATNLDISFENALARATSGRSHSGFLAFLVNPTHGLENSSTVKTRLNSLRPASRFAARQAALKPSAKLPDLGPAPEFTNTQQWFNTPGGTGLTLSGLRGHVVLVDFWTYTCINCIRTLPFLTGLYRTYRRYGLQIVGVETPEFTFEQDPGNVAQAIRSDGLHYPVVQDNRYGTWNAYQNQYWPAEYLIDARGRVRHTQFGEGDYKQSEAAVRQLLYDAGAHRLPPPMTAHAIVPAASLATPETYLDDQRSHGFAHPLLRGTHVYSSPSPTSLALNEFALNGVWLVNSESSTPLAGGASISARVQAAAVYLVMTSGSHTPRRVQVLLDGHPLRTLTVAAQRLYTLATFRQAQQHLITVKVPLGVSAYDFTFG